MSFKPAFGILILVALIFAGCATENPVQKPGYAVIKVNRTLLDQFEYETDVVGDLKGEAVYQYDLRHNAQRQFGARFHIKWKAPRGAPSIRLVLDVRGLNTRNETTLDKFIENYTRMEDWAEWTTISITGDRFKHLGTIMAWRVSIYSGDRVMAELPSADWYSDIRPEPPAK